MASTPAAVRADPFAFLTLFVGGLAGVLQLFLPWFQNSPTLKSGGTMAGWKRFTLAWPQQLGISGTISALAIVIAAAAGGALILLACLMLSRIDHQPLGLIAMVLALVWFGASVFRLIQQRTTAGGLGSTLSQAQLGFWLFLVGGLIALLGAIKAIATR